MNYKHIRIILPVLVLAMPACTDDIVSSRLVSDTNADGMQFALSVNEQAYMTTAVGNTRSTADSVNVAACQLADRFAVHALKGGAVSGLNVHRMPLPFVGIHHGSVGSVTSSATRASVDDIVSDDIHFHDSLTIWGYTDAAHELFHQTTLTKIRNWRSSAIWPYGDTYMRFFAIAPSMENMEIEIKNTPGYSAPPVFSYTLPNTAGEMRDLLYGSSGTVDVQAGPRGDGSQKEDNLGEDNKLLPLQFYHILTAVRFAEGIIPSHVTIKEIRLDNICNKGDYNPSTEDPTTLTTGTWTNVEGEQTYTIVTDGTPRGTNHYIDQNQVLFMIPHTLGSSARLDVILEETLPDESIKEHTLTCSLEGDVWKKGFTMTYKLTIGELEDGYYLIAEQPMPFEHSDKSISSSFNLHSYRAYKDYASGTPEVIVEPDMNHPSAKYNVGWELVGLSDTEEGEFKDPSTTAWTEKKDAWGNSYTSHWLNSITTSGSGYSSVVNFSIDAQNYTRKHNHQEILKSNTEASYNLYEKTTNGTTISSGKPSNCYIVNRTGTFTIPLCYGNWSSEKSDFVDHQGDAISSQWLSKQLDKAGVTYAKGTWDGEWEMCDESEANLKMDNTYDFSTSSHNSSTRSLDASLLWQDVWQDGKGLIGNITLDLGNDALDKEKGSLTFTVLQKVPGNAVIVLTGKKLTYYRTKEGDVWNEWQQDVPTKAPRTDTLWTWHVWMTDEVYPNSTSEIINGVTGLVQDNVFLNYNRDTESKIVALEDKDGTTHNILPVNLGWVPDEMNFGFYSHREVWAKFRQTDGHGDEREEVVVKIEQQARQDKVTGTSVIYQWGRPTPFPMLIDGKGNPRAVYNIAGIDISSRFTLQFADKLNKGDAIGRPSTLLRWENSSSGGNAWFNPSSAPPAYWSSSEKTPYDPCPAGFNIPESSIFTGLSRTGSRSSSGSDLNVYPDSVGQSDMASGKGAYFYTTHYTDGATLQRNRYQYGQVYIPVTREWQGDEQPQPLSTLTTNNTFGIYWCADAPNGNKQYGPVLWFRPDYGYYDDTKPAIRFGREPSGTNGSSIKYSSAQPIRPQGNLPE